jgi:hypothetical protein
MPSGRTWTFHLRDDVFWLRTATDALPGSDDPVDVESGAPRYGRGRRLHRPASLRARCGGGAGLCTLFLIDGCERAFTTLEPTDAERAAVGIRAVDPVTLEFTLTRPAGYFLTLTSMPLFQPVPRELVDEMGNEWRNAVGDFGGGWQTPENLVTSGPFLVAPLTTTSQIMDATPQPALAAGAAGQRRCHQRRLSRGRAGRLRDVAGSRSRHRPLANGRARRAGRAHAGEDARHPRRSAVLPGLQLRQPGLPRAGSAPGVQRGHRPPAHHRRALRRQRPGHAARHRARRRRHHSRR